MNPLTKPLGPTASISHAAIPIPEPDDSPDSLFERFAWIYILCRENLFRDDTDRMIRRIWPSAAPSPQSRILELGCGPGFYSRSLASRFPQTQVLGIDNSKRQLDHARDKADELGLANCKFDRGNVLDLAQPDRSFSVVIASRLFTVLPQRERAVAEIFRVLQPGGRCFIAEPRYAFSASIPLLLMRIVARLSGYNGEYREPMKATALSANQFRALFETQPWQAIELWYRGRYQYALCEKA